MNKIKNQSRFTKRTSLKFASSWWCLVLALAGANASGQANLDTSGPEGLPGWIADVGARSEPTTTQEFSVDSYGAVNDGTTLCTTNIQSAIDAAYAAGGGVVTFSAGSYLTGSVFVKNHVHLRIDSGVTLLGSQNIDDYPYSRTRVAGVEMDWPAGLLNVNNATNAMVSGGGTIDGQGAVWWALFDDMRYNQSYQGHPYETDLRWAVDYACPRPRLMVVSESSDVTVRDLQMNRSGFWTVQLLYSEYVTVDGLIVRNNDSVSRSTDGVNVDSSSWVLVQNCDISNNDDCICMKAGRDWDGLRVNRPTTNVVIRNNVTYSGHGSISFGSETSGGIRNVVAYNNRAVGTRVGIRFKSTPTRGGTVEDILFQDFKMENVPVSFVYDLDWYSAYSTVSIPSDVTNYPACWDTLAMVVHPPEAGIPTFRNMTFRNIQAIGATTVFDAAGLAESSISNLVFRSIVASGSNMGTLSWCNSWGVEVESYLTGTTTLAQSNCNYINLTYLPAGDSDGDGALDSWEMRYGTDPRDPSIIPPSAHSNVTVVPFVGIAESGIGTNKAYTHAVSGGAARTVSGVAFNAVTSTVSPSNFTWSTTGSNRKYKTSNTLGNWTPANGGLGAGDQELIDLLGTFIYTDDLSQTYTLTGLTPGKGYDLRLYIRTWDPAGIRAVKLTFSNGTETLQPYNGLPEDRPDLILNNGNVDSAYYLNFRYQAQDADVSIEAAPVLGYSGSFHFYGLTNEELGQEDITAAPTRLRVNDVVNPVGTGAAPWFGWQVNDPDANEIQTAYQILTASTAANLTADNGDLWDSGMVSNRAQNHVAYAGAALSGDRNCFWKVRTWDKDGNASAWSAPASFTVGLNLNENWTGANWIKRDTTDADDYTYYRKQLTLPNKTIERATVYISSAHKFALHLNGTPLGKGAAYHHPQYQYYNAYDITSLVQADTTNQFAVFNHWFGGGQGRPQSARGIIMKAIIRYTDGSKTELGTDGTWKQTRAAAWSLSDLAHRNSGEGVGYVERIDARKLMPDWYTTGFDDSAWSTATVIGAHPVGPWSGTLAPDLTRIEEIEIKPVSISNLGSGKYVVDLGKVYAGVPRIEFSGGASGTYIRMRGGDALDGSGAIDPSKNQSTDMNYRAWLNGGAFTFEPVEYLGMRYFEIDNAPMPLTTNNFSFIVRHSAMDPEASSFESPNATLNAVWDFMKHSLLTCAQEEFVDTPTREKGGFLGDAAIQSTVAMPVMNERALTQRVLNEFLQSVDQHWSGTGRMNAVYPNNDGARDIPDFTQSYPVWVWNYYMETGDLDFIDSNYAYLKAIADYVHAHRNSGTGLISNLAGGSGAYQYGIVDWPATMRFGYDMTYARTVINGWAYADYDVVSKLAEALGNTADRDAYRSRAEDLKTAMNAELMNGGVYVDGLDSGGTKSSHVSQHANMFPLALGIVPSNNTASVINTVKELEMSVGMVTLPWLIRAIGEADEGEHLIELFTNEEWLGWAQCLSKGATATWESWDADTAGQSLSHAWGAAGLEGYVRYILGIKPLKPQYEEVQIKPLDFGIALNEASGTIPTDRGDISVAWQNQGATYTLQVSLPVNAEASVAVLKGPETNPFVYLDGIETAGTDDGKYIWIHGVGSGVHTLVRSDLTVSEAPGAPENLEAEAVSESRIDLSWTPSTNAAGYTIKRSTASGGPYAILAAGVTATNYSDTGLSPSIDYWYVVSAVNAAGESAASPAASATTKGLAYAPISVANSVAGITVENAQADGAGGLLTTASFNMNGGNAVALFLTSEGLGGRSSLSATFAGQAMTAVTAVDSGTGIQSATIFYLINPEVTTGAFEVITDAGIGADIAYSCISLSHVAAVAGTEAAGSTSTSSGIPLDVGYTTATYGGFVLGAAVNNDYDNSKLLSLAYGNPDEDLLSHTLIDTSGHFHTYGDIAAAGSYTDGYYGQFQRTAVATVVFEVIKVPAAPADIIFSVDGAVLSLSWPSAFIGSRLLYCTNLVEGSWQAISGSETGIAHEVIISESSAESGFFSLVYP